jgi:hypothetical protein
LKQKLTRSISQMLIKKRLILEKKSLECLEATETDAGTSMGLGYSASLTPAPQFGPRRPIISTVTFSLSLLNLSHHHHIPGQQQQSAAGDGTLTPWSQATATPWQRQR